MKSAASIHYTHPPAFAPGISASPNERPVWVALLSTVPLALERPVCRRTWQLGPPPAQGSGQSEAASQRGVASVARRSAFDITAEARLFRMSENRDAHSRRAPSRLVLTRGQGLPSRRHLPGHPSQTLSRWALHLSQHPVRWCGGGVGCCVDPPYHVVLAVKVCVSAGRSLAPFGRLRTLTAALRREGFGLGQSRPIKTGVPYVAVFFLLRSCPVFERAASP